MEDRKLPSVRYDDPRVVAWWRESLARLRRELEAKFGNAKADEISARGEEAIAKIVHDHMERTFAKEVYGDAEQG